MKKTEKKGEIPFLITGQWRRKEGNPTESVGKEKVRLKFISFSSLVNSTSVVRGGGGSPTTINCCSNRKKKAKVSCDGSYTYIP